MEEKERYYLNYLYDIYALTDESLYICDNDNRFGKIETLKEIQNLLNQQDKHIKELEKENQQLKQQLHDLPKKIIDEIEKSFTEYLPLKYKTGAGFYGQLNAILKKYGGEDESLCCNVKQ